MGVILIMLCLGIIVAYGNISYNQNNDPTFMMSSNASLEKFKAYQGTLEEGMKGEASTSLISGISLSSSWNMVRYGLSVVFDFVTGGWIQNAVGLLGFGEAGIYLALILRLAFVFSIGFILLKILFKVKP